MDNTERARTAARARWSKTTGRARSEATEAARRNARPKDDTHFKRVETMARRLGYRLVPLEED